MSQSLSKILVHLIFRQTPQAIGLFAEELGWQTLLAVEEVFGIGGTPGRGDER